MGTPTESNATGDDASPYTVSRPAGVSGQLTVVVFAVDGQPTLTWPTGYTEFFTQSRAGGFTIFGAYHQEDGTEGTTFDITSSASEKWAAIVYSVSGAENPATRTPEASTVDGSVASANPDPPSLTPTGGAKDYLWIAAINSDGEEADDDTWGNTSPTSYTPSPPRQKTSAVGGVATTNIALETAERAVNGASEDPGTFANDVSHTYVGATIAIHPTTLQTKDLSDTVTFSDSQTRGVSYGLADTVTFADSQTRGVSIGLTDTVTFADALTKGLLQVFDLADTVSFTDSVTKGASKGLDDTASFLDSMDRAISAGLSDLVSFSESLGATLQGGSPPPPTGDTQGGPSMFPQPQPRPFVSAFSTPGSLFLLVSVIGGTGAGGGLIYLNHRGVVSRRFALIVGSNVVFGFFILLVRVAVIKIQPISLSFPRFPTVQIRNLPLSGELVVGGVLAAVAVALVLVWWREEKAGKKR